MKTIDIITSNNVTIQYELGSIAQRFVALLLDLVIVVGIFSMANSLSSVCVDIASSFDPSPTYYDYWSGEWLDRTPSNTSYGLYIFMAILMSIAAGIVFIPAFFYRFLCEVLFNGRTVGKMAAGLRVIKTNGDVPTTTDYFLRSCFMLIDFWWSAGSFGFLSASSSDRNQRLGDRVADTCVIRLRPSVSYSIQDILSIKTAENYEPQYPGVTVFTDEDMLLIKNAIDRVRRFPNKKHKALIVELSRRSQSLLGIENVPKNKLTFLKTLLQDYIVLTRS